MKIPIATKHSFNEIIEKYGNINNIPKNEFIFYEFNSSPAKIKIIGSKGKGMGAMSDRLFAHYKYLGFNIIHFNDNIKNNNNIFDKFPKS